MKRVLKVLAIVVAVPVVGIAAIIGAFVIFTILKKPYVPNVPPLNLLAQTARFQVGDSVVRLPLVAASWAGRSDAVVACENGYSGNCAIPLKKIAVQMQQGNAPIDVWRLSVRLDKYDSHYDSFGEVYVAIPDLCPELEQKWAREICLGNIDRFGNGWLRNFELVDSAYLHRGWYQGAAVGGAVISTANAVQMILDGKTSPGRSCGLDEAGKALNLCVAAHSLSDDVLVVWIVSQKGGQTEVDRDARMIEALFRYSFGEEEDFQSLLAVIESLREE